MASLEFYTDKIENKTHTIIALVSGIVVLISAFIASDGFFSKYAPTEYLKWVYIFIVSAWISYWIFNRFWIPKNNKKNTGLVICIHADSDEAEQRLKRDFISLIKKQIESEQISEIFNIIVIKNHLASKYNTPKSVAELHKKVRGHIYIFGETKKRKNGDDQYFLSLDGLVLHRPVAQQVSQELSKDFLATLPKGINFKDEFAFKGFQISADIVVKSVKYIVGIASFISGNPFISTKLHTNLKAQILSATQRMPGDNAILSKIDDLLSNEYALIALYFFGKNDQANARENLALALGLNKNCYRALIAESIMAFSWENDAPKSLSITKQCHGFNEPEWRYNEAFLHFWLGNYPSAWKQCEKLKNQNYPNDFATSVEVTQFNEALISSGVNKPILYFWLGYNYYFRQGNLPMALKNLEIFEKSADASMANMKQKSVSWISEIKQKMSIK